jgi:hypothetical protein
MKRRNAPQKSTEERLADNIRLVGPDIAAVSSLHQPNP